MLPHNPIFKLNFVFDTNAVRKLGKISQKEWEYLYDTCKPRGYQTSWIPRVLQELIGSNLNRKSPLTDGDVAEIRYAVIRFEQLSNGDILSDTEDLIKQTICKFAGKTIPLSQRLEWRSTIDFFLREVTTANQIESYRNGNSWGTILKNKNLSNGWKIPIIRGFKDVAKQNADIIKKLKANNTQDVRGKFFDEWLEREYRKHQFSIPEMKNILSTPFEKLCVSPIIHGMMLDCYYTKGTALDENDYFDIDIATYLGVEASILISDEDKLIKFCNKVFADNKRIIKFDEFIKSL